jgi:hypothetical protein
MLGDFVKKFSFQKNIVSSKSSKNFTVQKCGVPTNLDLFKANKECHVSGFFAWRTSVFATNPSG